MQERRSEVRMLCADLVRVCWSDEEGKRHRTSALLEDISVSGVCLQTETPLPIGAQVRWRTPKQEFTGNVRYCEYREIGYFVGVELRADSQWSRQTFQPQHFLDVKRLMHKLRT
ncbi:MAG TPA: PilZ domain-containing protein [Bryobacteraceae bacterium]|nr:PilZ domain-containing protein [Bryobacteraceae bacterium]